MIRAIKKLTNDKAPGLKNVPPNAFKALSSEHLDTLLTFFNDYWDEKVDFEEWHEGQVVPVPKSGDLSDPNKWRGVTLMDIGSKIFSSILCTRLFKIISKHGVKYQFGSTPGVGCQDGTFTIKTILHLRHQHNLQTWVAFADLVKAFDTSNHKLLIEILARYGCPPKLCMAIKRMYADSVVRLIIGKFDMSIPFKVGVKQGDSVAPVLFLFLMMAFAETLEQHWIANGLTKATFSRCSNSPRSTGQLISHKPKDFSKGILFQIFCMLYVDDGAFLFESREHLEIGVPLLLKHFSKFGLEMHIGNKNKPSKTECVFFPKPGFFKPPPALPPPNSPTNSSLVVKTKKRTESEKKKREREDLQYENSDETKIVMVENGFVTFTRHFKYLGSHISYNLTDDHDIDSRISAASSSMGALAHFWNDEAVDLRSKYLIFMAIPMNLLLWGSESWALRTTLLSRLEVFLHRSIRRIMGITMTNVREEKITNSASRRRFYNIPTAEQQIAKRQLTFIGKIARNSDCQLPTKLLTAWCNHPQPKGGVLHGIILDMLNPSLFST